VSRTGEAGSAHQDRDVCALRERLRECERITARNVVLEARRLRAVDVLEGRA